MESRKQEVNIFKGTNFKLFGLKFDGSSVLSFLWIKIVIDISKVFLQFLWKIALR